MSILGEIPTEEWREMLWWPNGREAYVYAGLAGHEREIVVNIDGYSHDPQIPQVVSEVLASELPETWKLENRGSRIEIHPSGHFAGGWCDDDLLAVQAGLERMGLVVKEIWIDDA